MYGSPARSKKTNLFFYGLSISNHEYRMQITNDTPTRDRKFDHKFASLSQFSRQQMVKRNLKNVYIRKLQGVGSSPGVGIRIEPAVTRS